MGKGIINIELEGLSEKEINRFREMIDLLFIKKVFSIRNGCASLHFDNDGIIQEITYETRWRRNKADTIAEQPGSVKIT